VVLIGDSGATSVPGAVGAAAALIGAVATAVATLTPIIRKSGAAPSLVSRRTATPWALPFGGSGVAAQEMWREAEPRRQWPWPVGLAKLLWYFGVAAIGASLCAFTAYIVVTGRSNDTQRDTVVAVLTGALAVYAGASLVNAAPQWQRRRLGDWLPRMLRRTVTLRVDGDHRLVGEQCIAALVAAGLRVHEFDVGDERSGGWALGMSTYAGDFLGGTVALLAMYSCIGERRWEIAVSCDVLREKAKWAWGRTVRTSDRFTRALLTSLVSHTPPDDRVRMTPVGNGHRVKGRGSKSTDAEPTLAV